MARIINAQGGEPAAHDLKGWYTMRFWNTSTGEIKDLTVKRHVLEDCRPDITTYLLHEYLCIENEIEYIKVLKAYKVTPEQLQEIVDILSAACNDDPIAHLYVNGR